MLKKDQSDQVIKSIHVTAFVFLGKIRRLSEKKSDIFPDYKLHPDHSLPCVKRKNGEFQFYVTDACNTQSDNNPSGDFNWIGFGSVAEDSFNDLDGLRQTIIEFEILLSGFSEDPH